MFLHMPEFTFLKVVLGGAVLCYYCLHIVVLFFLAFASIYRHVICDLQLLTEIFSVQNITKYFYANDIQM